MEDLNVFTLFSYLENDIYLIKLYNALKKEGINAYDMKNPSKLLSSKILHIHWIEYYISSKSFFRTLLKTIFFPPFFLFTKYILRKKIIISLHNVEMQEKHFPTLEKIGFKFYLNFIANKVILFSRWQEKELYRNYGIKLKERKIGRTDLTSYIGDYKNQITRKKARKKLGIKGDKTVFLVFGRLDEYKGIYDVINFLKKEKNRDYAVLFAGKPGSKEIEEELKKLKKEQGNNIILKTGYFSDKDIPTFMNASDIGLLAQNVVTNSGVLMLFGAFKMPVIARDSIAFRENLGSNAIYYNDYNELKRIIDNLDKKIYRKLGKDFYDNIKKITWKKIAKDTLKIYNEAINGS